MATSQNELFHYLQLRSNYFLTNKSGIKCTSSGGMRCIFNNDINALKSSSSSSTSSYGLLFPSPGRFTLLICIRSRISSAPPFMQKGLAKNSERENKKHPSRRVHFLLQKNTGNDERQIMTSKEVVSLALFSCHQPKAEDDDPESTQKAKG